MRSVYFGLGWKLACIGFAGQLLSLSAPLGLRFAFFLVGELRFVGLFYCWYSGDRRRLWILGVTLLSLYIGAVGSAMFHELLLSGALISW